ncbi:Sec-independent protein translocase family protein [Glacieibacterium frigidum]|uniref:Uncharacterized protein n=1 Tax=Glacieibacterium frigidum TaxID=2593303 RepID=A0A552U7S5_9SPHN|nr:hypothetical protein [Glacieibacterium frigidum]TRW14268.1 hypothetical protein FMM06_11160 [Glacieibacterium frigidum]
MGGLTLWHWLIAILVLVFISASLGDALNKRRNREKLYPASDPTRIVLASLVINGFLFRRLILTRKGNPFQALAPEPGLDMPLILAACRDIETRARWLAWAVVAATLVTAIVAEPAGLVLLVIGLLTLRGIARFHDATQFRRNRYDAEAQRQRYLPKGVATTEEAVPVSCSGVADPFLGLGINLGSWNLSFDTTRGARGRDVPPERLEALEVELAMTRAVGRLQLAGATLGERLFVSGVDARGVAGLQGSSYARPASSVSVEVAAAYRNVSSARGRLYRTITIVDWGGEVVLTYAFRCVPRGAALAVEVVKLALPPIANSYRGIDEMRYLGVWGAIKWFSVSLTLIPLDVIGAFASAAAQLPGGALRLTGSDERRERREVIASPAYNYGATWSLRQHISANTYPNWFQKIDAAQHFRIIEEQIFAALVDLLESHGIDSTAISAQANVLQTTNISVTAARDVTLQGVAIGAGAQAGAGPALGRPALRKAA